MTLGATIAAQPRLSAIPQVRRRADWEHRLQAWINAAQSRRFVWGDWDCCMAMCDAVRAMTDSDPGVRVRGQYSDQLEVARLVMRLTGVATFEGAVAAELAQQGIPPADSVAQARRGDVAAFDQPAAGPTWGVVDLTGRRVVAASLKGLVWAPLDKCRRAWLVG